MFPIAVDGDGAEEDEPMEALAVGVVLVFGRSLGYRFGGPLEELMVRPVSGVSEMEW